MTSGENENKYDGYNQRGDDSEPIPLIRRDDSDTNYAYDSVVRNSMPPPPNPNRNGQSTES